MLKKFGCSRMSTLLHGSSRSWCGQVANGHQLQLSSWLQTRKTRWWRREDHAAQQTPVRQLQCKYSDCVPVSFELDWH